jgi:hypothetical protein
VTYGREGLRNALCNWYTARNGDLYLVCAGVAWHAGRGVKGTNTTLIGNEAENDGRGEPFVPRSLDAQAALNAECCREFGFGPDRCWEHKEHAPSRKVDRYGIYGPAWRRRVAHILTGPTPAPAPPPSIEEEDVIVPVHVPPGEHRVFHVEPTTNEGRDSAIGAQVAILVLNAVGNNRVPIWVYFQALGEASPKKRDLWGGQGPLVVVVENKPMGWLDIANNGSDDIGGSLIYVR